MKSGSTTRVMNFSSNNNILLQICKHCGGGDDVDIEEGVGCISLACKVFFERSKVQKECKTAGAVKNRIRL